jgi:uncharacterized membrane protein YbhN (UPF0104 family)
MFNRVAVGYGLILLVYLAMLLIVDKNKGFFEYAALAMYQLPALMSFALLSYFLRYLRWHLLLRLSGHPGPFFCGWWAYLSGYALTATPGKVGELLRIRYFHRLGISADRVTSAFVFERALDLAVVFALASIFIADVSMFWLAATFVSLFLVSLIVAGLYPEILMRMSAFCVQKRWLDLSRVCEFIANILIGCRFWISPVPLLLGLVLGGAAWSVTAFTFVYLLYHLDINMPWLAAFSTYPMAMLAGAASMLPGGVGSTEAAVLIAVVIRLGTMWFSVLCGFFAILLQEIKFVRSQ